jgi:phage terminase large subunit
LSATATNPLVEFVDRYFNDPVLFVQEVLGGDPDEKQKEIMRAVARGDRRIAVRSGHRVGKTTALGQLIVWHGCTHFPQKTVATAATGPQLFDALYAETVTWFNKLPPTLRELFDIKSDVIELAAAPKESFISFRTSRAETPEAMAGVHSAFVLLLCDEASGIPEQVYEAAIGSMANPNACMILTGNPVRTSGMFFNIFKKALASWTRFHISCVGHPRIPLDFIQQVIETYGEESNAYRVRVLGEFPLADDDAFIPYEHMETALNRDVKPMLVKPAWGLDCARKGRDRSALAKRRGNVLEEKVKSWSGLDTMQLVGRVKAEWDTTLPSERPDDICVDAIGIGAGVADRLIELGLPARVINVSESAALSERFANLRAELWWKGKEWFAERSCNLAGDEQLGAELVDVHIDYTSSGKIIAESKKEIKKRGQPSPDLADSFILTFASNAATALHGSKSTTSSRAPLKRNIKGIV